MNSDIYQHLYDFEQAQRDHLIAAVNIPIIAITALGGALVAMALGFPYSKSVVTIFFLICSAAAALVLLLAIVNVFRSILGYEYARTTSPKRWQAYYDALLAKCSGLRININLPTQPSSDPSTGGSAKQRTTIM